MGEKMMAVEKENQVPDVEVTRYDITNMVYFIRNQQVMLDSDLAMLYQVETKNLNKAMKRNGQRFPKDFCFQLSKEEYDNLRFQIGTSSLEDNNYGGRRYLPYVYTEQGISMLASVLRSEVAINVSIGIMRAFVEMRRFIANNALLFDRISNIELKQLEYQKQTDEKLEQVFNYISGHEETSQKIFFEGQIYDAFSLLVSLIQKGGKGDRADRWIYRYRDVKFTLKKRKCRGCDSLHAKEDKAHKN